MLILLLACDAPPAETAECSGPPDVLRVDEPAGYRIMDIPVDAPWLSDARTVPLNVWYATAETSGSRATYVGTFVDEQAWVNADFSPPPGECKAPLVVYSHGSQGWGGNNSPLLRHLVSQGWVAAAPDHVGNTIVDDETPRRISYSFTRAADVLATIDAFENLDASDPLAGRVDTSKVLVLGHSFGGQTAWMLAGPDFDLDALASRCETDELGCTGDELAAFAAGVDDARVAGVMPMDGFANTDLISAAGWEATEAPIYFLSKAEENDDVPLLTAALADPVWARFDGACHETFTNSVVQCDTFDKTEGHDVVAQYLSSFAARTVFGSENEPYASILDGTTVVDARVSIHEAGQQ